VTVEEAFEVGLPEDVVPQVTKSMTCTRLSGPELGVLGLFEPEPSCSGGAVAPWTSLACDGGSALGPSSTAKDTLRVLRCRVGLSRVCPALCKVSRSEDFRESKDAAVDVNELLEGVGEMGKGMSV
jgi:hypothetical protein